jgi:hypothetical protein
MNQAKKEITPSPQKVKNKSPIVRPQDIKFGNNTPFQGQGGMGNNRDNNNGASNYGQNNNNRNNNNDDNKINQIIMKYQPPKDDPMQRPEIIPKLKNVALLVKKIYYEIYKDKVGEYPKGYIEGVIRDYEKIRTLRYNEMKKKTNDKFGLKGLRSSAIVAVLMYCSFIGENNPIPAPVYLAYVNDAIKRKGFKLKRKIPREKNYIWHGKKKGIPKVTRWKPQKEGKPEKKESIKIDMDFSTVSMKMFDEYRTSDKKGIKKYIMRLTIGQRCYKNKVHASQFVHLMGRMRMGFSEQMIKECREVCEEIVKKKIIDPMSVPSGTIALSAMLFTAVKNELPVTKETFGIPNIPEATITRHYKKIAESIEGDVRLEPFKTEPKKKKQSKTEKKTVKVNSPKKIPLKITPRCPPRKPTNPRGPQEDYKILVE